MDTLQDFQVNYKHVTIPGLATDGETEVITWGRPMHNTK